MFFVSCQAAKPDLIITSLFVLGCKLEESVQPESQNLSCSTMVK